MDTHNKWLEANYTAALEPLVPELHASITTALADVKGVIDNLNALAAVGMPATSRNAFSLSYPLQKCDVPTPLTGAQAAAGHQFLPGAEALLKGDGSMPLPAGSEPVSPATRAAASTTAMPTTDSVAAATTVPGVAAQSTGTTAETTMGTSGQSIGGLVAKRFVPVGSSSGSGGAEPIGSGATAGGSAAGLAAGSILRGRFNLDTATSGSATTMGTTGTTGMATGGMAMGRPTHGGIADGRFHIGGSAAQPMDTPAAGGATATGSGIGAAMGDPVSRPSQGGSPVMAAAAQVNATTGSGNRKLLL